MVKIDLDKLAYSEKIKLSNGRFIKHIKIEELKEFDFKNYYTLVFIFLSKPYDLAHILYQKEVDYQKITHYELFNQLFIRYFFLEEIEDEEFKEDAVSFINFINHIFYGNIMPIVSKDEKISYIDYDKKEVVIDENIFDEIFQIIKTMVNHENKKEEKFANDIAKEMYFENLLEEAEDRKLDDDKTSFFSLITVAVLNTSYTYKTALELNLYQFFQLISKSLKRENAMAIKQGIYSGAIDTKKISSKDYNWL